MKTALVLFVFWMLGLIGVVFLTLSGSHMIGRALFFQGGGIATTLAVVGAVIALYIVRREQKPIDNARAYQTRI